MRDGREARLPLIASRVGRIHILARQKYGNTRKYSLVAVDDV